MNYREKHSHKWAKILKEAFRRAQLVNRLHDEGKTDDAKKEFEYLYGGDFRDQTPEKIFPGLKLMAPYWKAVEGEMECRLKTMLEFSGNMKSIPDEPQYKSDLRKFYQMFIDDVKEILNRDKMLDFKYAQKYLEGGFDVLHLPDNWDVALRPMKERWEADLLTGKVNMELLADWFVFCLRGIVAYDYNLIKQALFVSTILKNHGEEALHKVFDDSKEEFGWRVSRLFYVDMLPRAGIEGADLMRMGRYSMFCDQDLVSETIMPPEEEAMSKPQIKFTKFFNCQEYSIFATIAEHIKVPLKKIGIGVCIYCEEHARKTTKLFVPPVMKPVLKMEKALGLEDDICLCKTMLYPEDDMERFMDAQDKVFYYQP
ncbi:MAG: hypothetical protein HZA48_09665 [Planctomycetes bacterium]|nr:hypothetical protein [Planctomycetota bacterium]